MTCFLTEVLVPGTNQSKYLVHRYCVPSTVSLRTYSIETQIMSVGGDDSGLTDERDSM